MITVLNVAYPFAPVTPDAVGGAEQIASAVERAVARAGHRSLVLACEGSKTMGRLFTAPQVQGALTVERQAEAHERYRAELDRILAVERIDVVHMHGVDFHSYLPHEPAPVLATLHLPPEWYPPEVFAEKRPRTYIHCVSRSQRLRCPPFPASIVLDEVPNGVDLSGFHAAWRERCERRAQLGRSERLERHHRNGYALVLGRICPEKGTHLALDAAHRADVALLIAGDVFPFPEHVRYFENEVLPRLDGRRRFCGPVAMDEKRALLAHASCLIVASVVAETSSLVSMEALACGTPVVAFPNGALPEIVTDGRTGFLVRDLDAMAEAIGKAKRLAPEDCRASAERFAQSTMCSRYLALYQKLARASPPARPAQSTVHADVLTDRAELDALETEWGELWEHTPEATIFQRPEWLLPWCTHLLQGEPRVIAIRRGSRLIGLAPFFVWDDVLSLMGAGVSDYTDVLAAPGERRPVRGALGAWLDTAQGQGRCAWSEVPEGSLLLELAREPARRLRIAEQDVCPGIRIGARNLRDALSPHQWANVRNARNRAARAGELRITDATPETFDTPFLHLVELHGGRWRDRGGSILADARVRAFHLEAGPRLMMRGRMTLSAVHIDGAIMGVLYTFRDRAASRCYLCGFDPARAHIGPGTIAFAHALERAMERGDVLFDFLRGREAYKYAWGAEDVTRIYRIDSARAFTRASP